MEKYGVKCGRDFVGILSVLEILAQGPILAYPTVGVFRLFILESIIFCWVLHATHNQNKRVRVMSTANDKRKCRPNPKTRKIKQKGKG